MTQFTTNALWLLRINCEIMWHGFNTCGYKKHFMGDVKDLTSSEAVAKIKELSQSIKTCMFCTYDKGKMEARPMSSQKVDDDGNIWFLSDKNSCKNKSIHSESSVDLVFAEGTEKFMLLHGDATISSDKEKIRELWNPIAKIWFTEGVDDPAISVIKVSFKDGYYWDTKHGKMVEMAIMAAALVSGTTMDDGIEGMLSK